MTEREYILVRNLSHLWAARSALESAFPNGEPEIPKKSLVKVIDQIDTWTERVLKAIDDTKDDDEE